MNKQKLKNLQKDYAKATYKKLLYEPDSVPSKDDLEDAYHEGFMTALDYVHSEICKYMTTDADNYGSFLIPAGELIDITTINKKG